MSTTTHTDSAVPSSDEHKSDPGLARRRFRRLLILGGAVVLIALVVGFIPQLRERKTAAADTKQLAIPTVAVVSPISNTSGSGLNLPAEVKPWQETNIFSRVNDDHKNCLVGIWTPPQQNTLPPPSH